MRARGVVAAILALLASGAIAQTSITPSGGSGGAVTISGSTATSGCVAGGVLRSISNLVDCGAGLTYASGVLTVTTTSSASALYSAQATNGAGYTGSAATFGGQFVNNAAGTGTAFVAETGSNAGVKGNSNSSTSGTNIGAFGISQNPGSGASYGVIGYEVSASGAGQKVGGFFYAGAGSGVRNGVVALLGTTQLGGQGYASASAAVLADNGASGLPVALFRNNGSDVGGIDNGGGWRIGSSNITGTTVAATINNGTSTGNILNLQDNGTNVFTVADGGNVTSTATITAKTFDLSGTADTVGTSANYIGTNANIIKLVGTNSDLGVGGANGGSLLMASGGNGTSGQRIALRGFNGATWADGVSVTNTSASAPLTVTLSQNLKLERTVTAAATTGAQTIDKMGGAVNFAAAATTLVVTNNRATTTSLIFLTPQTADATCTAFSAVRASGSFTITANAACTAETAVAFLVTN